MSQDPKNRETTAALLERLTLACVTAINERDWTYSASAEAREFLSHVDTFAFTAQFDSYPQVMSWQQQNEAWQTMFGQNPQAKFNVTSISVTVEEAKGSAVVMMESEVPNMGGLTLHGLSEAKWRKVAGRWWFYHTTGMRGAVSNTGFVG